MGSDTYLPYGVFFSCVDDVDDYFVVSLAGHSEAGIKGIEYFAGVYEQPHASPTSYEDAAVATVVDAVAGFEHGASDGKDGVERHLLTGLALGAMGRWAVKTRGEGRQEQHLATILRALVKIDLIRACWESALGVLEGVADGGAIGAKKAFADFTLREGALEMNFHFFQFKI